MNNFNGIIFEENPEAVYKTMNSGLFKAVEYIDNRRVIVKFIDTGYEKLVTSSQVRRGSIKDPYYKRRYGVGFLGEGEYSHRDHPMAYTTWSNMLRRTYRDGEDKCYDNVEVCKDWHNFQNFAEWFISNHVDDMTLDKDLFGTLKGISVYSPETCVFIPTCLNAAIGRGRAKKAKLPRGVLSKNMKTFYAAITDYETSDTTHYGPFYELVGAHNEYKRRRKIQLLEMINRLLLNQQIDIKIFFRVIDLLPNIDKHGDIYETT